MPHLDDPILPQLFLSWGMCEELTLAMGVHHDRGQNPGQCECKPSALPLDHPVTCQ